MTAEARHRQRTAVTPEGWYGLVGWPVSASPPARRPRLRADSGLTLSVSQIICVFSVTLGCSHVSLACILQLSENLCRNQWIGPRGNKQSATAEQGLVPTLASPNLTTSLPTLDCRTAQDCLDGSFVRHSYICPLPSYFSQTFARVGDLCIKLRCHFGKQVSSFILCLFHFCF